MAGDGFDNGRGAGTAGRPGSSRREADANDDIERAARARHGNPFLNTAQAAHYLGLSTRSLERMRGRGEGPRYRRHRRYVRYHIDDLIGWSQGGAGSGDHD